MATDLLRRLRSFHALDRAAKMRLAGAFLLPCAIAPAFRLLGVSRTQGILRAWGARGMSGTTPSPEEARTIIAGWRRAQQTVRRTTGVGGSCLVRSFTLWAVLLRRGIHSDVRVGMRKRDGRFEGHAWVEYEGQPLNEVSAIIETYSTLPEPAMFDVWRGA